MKTQVTQKLRVVAVFSLLFFATATSVAQSEPDKDCQCRDSEGSMKNLGTVVCVNITGQQYLVRCEMSQNTPYWKRLNDESGCPAAGMTNSLEKLLSV